MRGGRWCAGHVASLAGALLACAKTDVALPVSMAIDSAFTVEGHPIPPAALNRYIAERLGFTSRGGAMQCAYLPLGQDSTLVYVNSLCLELMAQDDSVVTGSGRGGPIALRVGIEGDSVRVRSHQVPIDGGGHLASMRGIFPARIVDRIVASDISLDTLAAFLRARAATVAASRRCYVGNGSILGRAPGSPAPGPATLEGWLELHGPITDSGRVRLIDSDGRSLDASRRGLGADSVSIVAFNDLLRVELRVSASDSDSTLRGKALATSDAAESRDTAGRSGPFRREWRLVARRRPCEHLPQTVTR